jgi:rifampicin phosphotransferase
MHTTPTSSSLIALLDSPELPLEEAGGKGLGLVRLIRAGFPVPLGFVITASAYRAFVDANRLADDLARVDVATAVQVFTIGEIPQDIAENIVAAYTQLVNDAPGPVAVRSSATTEDLTTASAAGQHETVLNVTGEAELLHAVRRCWASLWSERAIAYRAHHEMASGSPAMAVVVQQLVPADAAGVMFTLNPASGDEREVLLNAAWGFGDTLVNGQIEPDEVVVDKSTGAVKRYTLGDKSVMSIAAAGGVAEVAVPESKRRLPALTTSQATELALFGRDIEAALGGAQDIEWAIAAGRPVILQARPVTRFAATSSIAVPGDDAWLGTGDPVAQPFDLWTHADMAERWPEPVTPLTWSLADLITNSNFAFGLRDFGAQQRTDIQWARRFFGRVYMNEGALGELFFQAGMPTALADKALGSGVPERLKRKAGVNFGRLLRAAPRIVRTNIERQRNERASAAQFVQIERRVREFESRNLATATERELWHELHTVWVPRFRRAIDLHADVTSQAMVMASLLDGLVARWLGGEHLASELLTGIDGVLSAQMVPALWAIATELRQANLAAGVLSQPADEALQYLRTEPSAAPAMKMLGSFLEQHGHRARSEGELLYPRWAEAPEQVISALIGYLQSDDPTLSVAAAHDRLSALQAEALGNLDPARRWLLQKLIDRAKHLIRLRDNGQHFIVKLLLPIRQLCAELGVRWAQSHLLAQAEDVFFLNWQEMEATVAHPTDHHAVVAGRRAAYEHWFTVAAPEVVDARGAPVIEEIAGDTRLSGLGASGGRVTGVARIANSPAEAALLQHGEILVARSTDPGWTPAFALAAGIVLEVGGQLSHGAIVAREYGLPAVMNVRDALVRIRSGQRVTVDGTAGCVYLHDD